MPIQISLRDVARAVLVSFCMLFIACDDEEDPSGTPGPIVLLPDCGGPIPVVSERNWTVEMEPTLLSFWGDGKYYVYPGYGLVRRVPAEQLTTIRPSLGIPAIGHGGSAVVTAGSGPAIMIDAGSGVTRAIYTYQLRALMDGMGVRTISQVHITHLHRDHFNQLESVVITYRVPAGAIVVPDFMVFFSPAFTNSMRRLTNNSEVTGLGYTPTPNGIDPYVESKTQGYLTARFGSGALVIQYVASEAAVRELQTREAARNRNAAEYMDAASALMSIRAVGAITRISVLGDVRGRTFLELNRAMGDREFDRMFRDVEIFYGFQHHFGVVETVEDVDGIVRVLRSAGFQSQRVRVIVQTDDAQLRRMVVEMVRRLGFDVTLVKRGTTETPANVVVELRGGMVRTGEREIESLEAFPESRAVLTRLYTLDQYRKAASRNRQQLERQYGRQVAQNVITALQSEFSEAMASYLRLGQLMGDALRGRGRGSRRSNDAARFNEPEIRRLIESINRPGLEAPIFARNPGLMETLRSMAREARINARINMYIEEALRTGSSSAQLRTLIEAARDSRPGPRARRARNELQRAVHESLRASIPYSVSGEVAAAGRGRRALTWTLAVAEVATMALEYVSMVREGNALDRANAISALMWWQQHGALPVAFGETSDGRALRNAYAINAALSIERYRLGDGGIRRLQLETDMPERMVNYLKRIRFDGFGNAEALMQSARSYAGAGVDNYRNAIVSAAFKLPVDTIAKITVESPTGSDWYGFLEWTEQNIYDLDDFYTTFVSDFEIIRHKRGTTFPDGPFEVRVWRDGSPRWVEDDQLTRIMRPLGLRMIENTNRELAAAWSRRENARALPAFDPQAYDRWLNQLNPEVGRALRPTARVRYKDGEGGALYSVYNQARYNQSWVNTPNPILLAYENVPVPEGYVLVRGAFYNDQVAIRSARGRYFDPAMNIQIPVPAARTEKHRRLLAALQQFDGEFVASPAGDYSGYVRFWQYGPNANGLALAWKEDIDFERVAPEPEAPRRVGAATPSSTSFTQPPPLLCSKFDRDVDGWTVVDNSGARADGPFHRATTDSVNGFIQWGKERIAADRKPLDLVIVFDITSSMNGQINAMRQAARQVVTRLQELSSDVRLGLVSYRDQEDGAGARQLYPLTANVAERLTAMDSWQASGGGDSPEDLLFALSGALSDQIDWRPGGLLRRDPVRAIVIITDASAKVNNGSDFAGNTFESVIAAAQRRKVQIHAVTAGGAAEPDARRLANATAGSVHTSATPGAVVDGVLGSAMAAIEGAPRYFSAPEKFTGSRASYFGTVFSFDAQCTSNTGTPVSGDDVVFSGGGGEVRLNVAAIPAAQVTLGGTVWNRREFALDTTAAWRDANGGVATNQRIRSALGALRTLKLRAEFRTGQDSCAVDNVSMGGLKRVN